MAKKSKSKKGKNRRVSPEKKARYWNGAHPNNMARRFRRVLRRFGQSQADRFASLHSERCTVCTAARIKR